MLGPPKHSYLITIHVGFDTRYAFSCILRNIYSSLSLSIEEWEGKYTIIRQKNHTPSAESDIKKKIMVMHRILNYVHLIYEKQILIGMQYYETINSATHFTKVHRIHP